MKVEVESPWTNGKEEFEGMLGFINQTKMQLEYYQKQKDTEYIRMDILGYTLILESKSEHNAKEFMRVKHEALRSGKRFENNMAIVRHLKDNGLWNRN